MSRKHTAICDRPLNVQAQWCFYTPKISLYPMAKITMSAKTWLT